jgi:hypothetical protein
MDKHTRQSRAELIWAAAFADKFRSCIEAVIVNIGGAGRDTSMTRTETCAAIASQHADRAVAAYMATRPIPPMFNTEFFDGDECLSCHGWRCTAAKAATCQILADGRATATADMPDAPQEQS